MSGPRTARVLVADDQAVVRQGIETLVGLIEGVTVVASAASGREAIELARETRPDVALLDLRMPGLDAVTTIDRVRRAAPGTAVLVLTSYLDGDSVLSALRAGACGYLTKDSDIEEIGRGIFAAAGGQSIFGRGVQEKLVAAVGAGERLADPVDWASNPVDPGLTRREREVLARIARGLDNREIAEEFVIAEVTVKTHVNRIFSKIGARTRAEAVAFAFRHGFAGEPSKGTAGPPGSPP